MVVPAAEASYIIQLYYPTDGGQDSCHFGFHPKLEIKKKHQR